MSSQTPKAPEHCGLPMTATDHFARDIPGTGVRVWECAHRPGHPEVYENMETGERIGEGQ